ncbi:hypothetical protein ABBQ32_011830 [Trebouxia sp. C0010 RCD-2024]
MLRSLLLQHIPMPYWPDATHKVIALYTDAMFGFEYHTVRVHRYSLAVCGTMIASQSLTVRRPKPDAQQKRGGHQYHACTLHVVLPLSQSGQVYHSLCCFGPLCAILCPAEYVMLS